MTVSRPSLRIRRGRWRTRAARRVANRGGAHRALQHGGEGGRRRTRPRWPAAALRTAPLPLPTWALEHAPQTPAPARGQCAGGRERCEDRSRGSGCRWCRWRSCPFQRTIMGSPSRNVQYHPPRLSEDRLNLAQPHSPSLPTHCSGKSGMRRVSCWRKLSSSFAETVLFGRSPSLMFFVISNSRRCGPVLFGGTLRSLLVSRVFQGNLGGRET